MPAPIDPRGATTGREEHLQRLHRPWGPTQAAGKQINNRVTRQVLLIIIKEAAERTRPRASERFHRFRGPTRTAGKRHSLSLPACVTTAE